MVGGGGGGGGGGSSTGGGPTGGEGRQKAGAGPGAVQSPGGVGADGWDYFGGGTASLGGGDDDGGDDGGEAGGSQPSRQAGRTLGSSGRTGSAIEENIVVALLPEKEGVFMFQHHNYEVSSTRRGSKVIRRYSDFVWLLECLHKRYPFRVLPLLPPKRVAVNGNHLSNDGAFIEKRRRGLARFLNALVRHPLLGQEQLVVMFLTVPTVGGFLSFLLLFNSSPPLDWSFTRGCVVPMLMLTG